MMSGSSFAKRSKSGRGGRGASRESAGAAKIGKRRRDPFESPPCFASPESLGQFKDADVPEESEWRQIHGVKRVDPDIWEVTLAPGVTHTLYAKTNKRKWIRSVTAKIHLRTVRHHTRHSFPCNQDPIIGSRPRASDDFMSWLVVG
jgi:hypothetical protein